MLLKVLFIFLCLYGLVGVLLYVFQRNLIIHPTKTATDHNYNFSYDFQEVYLPTNDGNTIHSLWFKNRSPSKGVMLYFHGNAGNLTGWGYVAEDILPYGYDLFIMDYRGFGKSTGSFTEKSTYQDAQVCYDYIAQHYPSNKIIVFGRSLGTGIASKVAADNVVCALVLESPYYSFDCLANSLFPIYPTSILLRYHFSNAQYITKTQCPVVILHGTEDHTVPYAQSELLQPLLKKGDELITIEGRGHNDLNQFPAYHERLYKKLDELK